MADLQVNERVWHIECNGVGVVRLFDVSGVETFDPTQAIEVQLVGKPHLAPITENDVLTYTMLMDGANG